MPKILSLILLLLFTEITYAQLPPFKEGERVAFIGNSITDGGHYHSYIWLYYMTHLPNRRIEFFNSGIGGDNVGQMYDRLEKDVFIHKPTVVTLTFGMNDVGYYDFLKPNADSFASERIKETYERYKKFETVFKQHPSVQKIMIATSPYDETVKGLNNYFPGKSAAMLKVVEFQEASARENNWYTVDFFRPMTEINSLQQKKDSTYTLSGRDRIHPGNDGHLVMASLFLKAQGFAGKPVAEINIDAATKKVNQASNCSITGLAVTDTKVAFTYLANSLPFPIDTFPRGWEERRSMKDALNLIPFMQEFNREFLQVNGLAISKKYALQIDGNTIGEWSGQQFSEGINLAEITTTPQYKQALQVMYLNEERWEIEKRLRRYTWVQYDFLKDKNLLFADNDAAMDSVEANIAQNGFLRGNKEEYVKARFPAIRDTWRKEMDLLINTIYTINKPVAHKITVTEVK